MVISTSNFPALYQQHLSHLHAVSWAVTHKPMLHSETRQTGQCALGEESLQHTLSWSLGSTPLPDNTVLFYHGPVLFHLQEL